MPGQTRQFRDTREDFDLRKPRIAIVSEDPAQRVALAAALAERAVPVPIDVGPSAVPSIREARVDLALVATASDPTSLVHAVASLAPRRPLVLLVALSPTRATRALGRDVADGYLEAAGPERIAAAVLAVLAGERPFRLRTGWLDWLRRAR
jgi:DNA-binding NarL/FixJ family response regulator